jgi:glutathione S-transferase
MSFQVIALGFSTGSVRRKYGIKYPDNGTGRYSDKLDDKDWEVVNNHFRTHLNYVEQIGSVGIALFASGVFYPRWSAFLGTVYIVARQVYVWGYRKWGGEGRYYGGMPLHAAYAAMIGTVYYGVFQTLTATASQ